MTAAGCLQSIRVLRVLCREEFSVAAAKTFVDDLKRAMQWLTGHFMYTPEQVCHISTNTSLLNMPPIMLFSAAESRLACRACSLVCV